MGLRFGVWGSGFRVYGLVGQKGALGFGLGISRRMPQAFQGFAGFATPWVLSVSWASTEGCLSALQ